MTTTNHLTPSPLPTKDAPKCRGSRGGGGSFNEPAIEKIIRLIVADGDASPRTIKSYTQAIRLYFEWCFSIGAIPEKANEEHILMYRAQLIEQYKPGTVKLYLRGVRLFYEALKRAGRRADNPAENVRAPKERTPDEFHVRQKALTREEVLELEKFIPSGITPCGARDRSIIYLMLTNGLRASEVAGLDRINIDRTFTFVEFLGKGSKKRLIRLSKKSRASLIDWIELRRPFLASGALFINMDSFNGVENKKLTVRTIERIVDKYLKFAGLKRPGRSAHALRHTYAMLAVLGGAEREAIGVSMGHASLSTTDVYIRAASQMQSNPAEAVESYLEKGEQ